MSDGSSLSKLSDSGQQQTHGEMNKTEAESGTSLIPTQPQQSAILTSWTSCNPVFNSSEWDFHGCFIEAM